MSGVVPIVPRFKFTDANGNPLALGSVTVYLSGTTTLASVYEDKGLQSSQVNPVPLDANGEALFWLDGVNEYKFLLKDSAGATVTGWPVDDIPGNGIGSFLQAGTGAVSRTAQNKLRDVVSVKDFGAVGDGVANDTTAVQAALTASKSVYFPPGTYSVGPVTAAIADGFIYGKNATLLKRSAGVLLSLDAAGIVCDGLILKGAQLSGDVVAVNAADCTIRNCTVQEEGASDVTIHGIQASNAANLAVRGCVIYGTVRVENADGFQLEGNRLFPTLTAGGASGVSVWAVTAPGNHADNFRIVGNYMEVAANSFGVVPLSRNGAVPPRNWTISDNVFVSNFACFGAISVDTCGFGTVQGNTYRAVAGAVSTAGIEVPGSADVSVTGNTIDCNSLAASAIVLNSSKRCTVSNNVAKSATNITIWINSPGASSDASQNIVSDNTVQVTVLNTIGVGLTTNNAAAVASDNLISSNLITSTVVGTTDAIKVDNVAGTAARNAVIGNLVTGTLRYGVSFSNTTDLLVSGNRVNGATEECHHFGGATTPLVIENAWQYSAAAPAAGTHVVRERYKNSAPTVGQPKAWVCTVAGTPGTWVSEGNL